MIYNMYIFWVWVFGQGSGNSFNLDHIAYDVSCLKALEKCSIATVYSPKTISRPAIQYFTNTTLCLESLTEIWILIAIIVEKF